MMQLIRNIIRDVDNQESSKRLLMLWVGIFLWSFVHGAIFFAPKGRFPEDLFGTIVFYDFVLIVSLAGVVLSEKIFGRKKENEVGSN